MMLKFKDYYKLFENNSYINLQDIMDYDSNSIPFIYTDDHKLFLSKHKAKLHSAILSDHPELIEKAKQHFNLTDEEAHEDLGNLSFELSGENLVLTGRVGNIKIGNKIEKVVGFWNTEKRIYDSLLKSCLSQLESKGLINEQTDYLTTPIHHTIPLKDLDTSSTVKANYDDMELYKKLHLMRGAEKQAAMKELGVGYVKKEHPMQTALKNAGLLNPGSSWRHPNENYNLSFKDYYLLKEDEAINNLSFPSIEEFTNNVNKSTSKLKLPDKILDQIQWEWLTKAVELFEEKFHQKISYKIRELIPWEEGVPVPLSAIDKELETATSPKKENIYYLLAHGMYHNRRTNNIKQNFVYYLFHAGLPLEFMHDSYITAYKSYLHFQNVKQHPEVKGIIDQFKDNPHERTNAAVLADKLQEFDHPDSSPILNILRGDHYGKKYAYNHFIFK